MHSDFVMHSTKAMVAKKLNIYTDSAKTTFMFGNFIQLANYVKTENLNCFKVFGKPNLMQAQNINSRSAREPAVKKTM